jgi:predicted AlkP superfamily phosphohydrolase/phosphomutase
MGDPKVVVVGLDAACFEQVDPLLADGALPTLERLIDDGARAPLETTTPPWTPSAWPSVVTGSRPWTHGVYDFYHYGGSEPSHVSARDVRAPFLWELLSAAGHSSIVVNVPVTHPAHAFDGSLVPGYIAPESADCLVDGEVMSVDAIDESYRIYPTGPRSDRLAEYERLVDSRAAMAERLAADQEWSFLMVQFQSTDAVFHAMGDDDGAIRRVFERVDAAVESLLSLAGRDAHVFVVSDHGMHRYEQVFHCNTWLRDQGYLRTTPETTRFTWNERTRSDLTDGAETDPLTSRVTGALVRRLRRVGVTPARVERALGTVGLDERVAALLPDSVLIDVVDADEHVDWTGSRAYCRSSAALGIRCNVVGRDPDGVVDPDAFDALRAELIGELRTMTGPSGDPVFERVYDRHRVHGADVANEASAPDIVVRPAGMVWEVSDIVRERTFGDTTAFNHSYEGLFVATGDQIDPDACVEPSVVDIAPTILALFGIAAPEGMDGRVLDDCLVDAPPAHDPPEVGEREFVGDDEAGISETVEDRLSEMGYIE